MLQKVRLLFVESAEFLEILVEIALQVLRPSAQWPCRTERKPSPRDLRNMIIDIVGDYHGEDTQRKKSFTLLRWNGGSVLLSYAFRLRVIKSASSCATVNMRPLSSLCVAKSCLHSQCA